MRRNSVNIISGADNQHQIGAAVDSNQLLSLSFLTSFGGDTQATGRFYLQASNDVCTNGNPQTFSPTNWIEIPNQTASISSGTSALLTLKTSSYRWVRPVFEMQGTGDQTITTIADTGALETILITCQNGATMAQGDFFVLSGPSGTAAVWISLNGNNTAPTASSYTSATSKIKVSIVTATTAIAVATAVATAAASTQGYTAVDNGDGTVTFTQASAVAVTAPSTHNSGGTTAGHFTAAVQAVGAPSNLNNKYFYLNAGSNDGGDAYYVWLNVNGEGVDPAIPNKTGLQVTLAAGDTNDTVAANIASVLAGVTGFSGTTATGHVVDVLNDSVGPFVPMQNINTPFTFAVVAGGDGTITTNMFTQSI